MHPQIGAAYFLKCAWALRTAKSFRWVFLCIAILQFSSCIGILYGISHSRAMAENPNYRYTAKPLDDQQNLDVPFDFTVTLASGRFHSIYVEFKLTNTSAEDHTLTLDSFHLSDIVDVPPASSNPIMPTYSVAFLDVYGPSQDQIQFMSVKNDSESRDPANDYFVGDKVINIKANTAYTGRVYFRLQTYEQALRCILSIILSGSDKPLATKVLLDRPEITS